jgi:hypothetical protein
MVKIDRKKNELLSGFIRKEKTKEDYIRKLNIK